MSGVSVNITDEGVREGLREARERIADLRPAMQEIGAAVQSETDLSFREQRDPWGNAWAALSDVTLSRRRGTSAQILSDTRRLSNSVNVRASAESVEIGTNVVYAAVHQFGNPANRMYNTPRGNPAPIPARPFLPIRNGGLDLPAGVRDDVMDIINRYLERGQ